MQGADGLMGACKGPPGTGKTRTILGLLGIILFSAPEGTSGLVIHDEVVVAELAPEDRTQLWLKASPWACGGLDVRWVMQSLPVRCHSPAVQ